MVFLTPSITIIKVIDHKNLDSCPYKALKTSFDYNGNQPFLRIYFFIDYVLIVIMI